MFWVPRILGASEQCVVLQESIKIALGILTSGFQYHWVNSNLRDFSKDKGKDWGSSPGQVHYYPIFFAYFPAAGSISPPY